MQTFNNVKIIDRADLFKIVPHMSGEKNKTMQILDAIVITTQHGRFTIARNNDLFMHASAQLTKRSTKRNIMVNGSAIVAWMNSKS